MIEQLPLPAFIVMLGFAGICSGLINAVRFNAWALENLSDREIA